MAVTELSALSLGDAEIGRVYEVRTTETTYFVARVKGSRVDAQNAQVYGLMVHCEAGDTIATAPYDTFARMVIRKDQTWTINDHRVRGEVQAIVSRG